MSIQHAGPSEVICLQPLGSKAIRLVLPAGKQIGEHKAPSEITVLCLEGRVKFTSQGQPKELAAGDFLYLTAADPHAVEAIEDSSLLVTILFKSAVN